MGNRMHIEESLVRRRAKKIGKKGVRVWLLRSDDCGTVNEKRGRGAGSKKRKGAWNGFSAIGGGKSSMRKLKEKREIHPTFDKGRSVMGKVEGNRYCNSVRRVTST